MPPPVRTPRSRWVDEGLNALAAGGPDAVRIDPLAKTLGVTRGGFYGFFADRQALLDELLDTWERRSTDEAREQVETRGGDPREKVLRAGLLTLSDELLPVDLAVRDWARRDPAVAARLRRVDDARMGYLRELIATIHPGADAVDIEARSLLAFSLAIGNHLIGVEHEAGSRTDVLRRGLEQILR